MNANSLRAGTGNLLALEQGMFSDFQGSLKEG
jgi:hypothetical protein